MSTGVIFWRSYVLGRHTMGMLIDKDSHVTYAHIIIMTPSIVLKHSSHQSGGGSSPLPSLRSVQRQPAPLDNLNRIQYVPFSCPFSQPSFFAVIHFFFSLAQSTRHTAVFITKCIKLFYKNSVTPIVSCQCAKPTFIFQ